MKRKAKKDILKVKNKIDSLMREIRDIIEGLVPYVAFDLKENIIDQMDTLIKEITEKV